MRAHSRGQVVSDLSQYFTLHSSHHEIQREIKADVQVPLLSRVSATNFCYRPFKSGFRKHFTCRLTIVHLSLFELRKV